MSITANDLVDAGFVGEDELLSSGSLSYRSEPIVDIVSGTISFAANTALINYDDPIQPGDLIVITGNAAAGTYTVSATNLNLDDHEVDEPIVDAAGGTANFRHPAGASRVGVDLTGLTRITSGNLQGALGDLDGAQPNAHAASHAENASDELNAEDLGAADGGFDNRVMVTTGTGGWVISDEALIGALPIEFQHADSLPASSTTSSVYQLKVLLTTTALQGGNYIVLYNAYVGGTQNGTVSAAEVRLDGTSEFGEVVLKSGSNDSFSAFAGHELFVGVTPGIHTIEIRWKRQSGGGSAEIKQAHISLWRVG